MASPLYHRMLRWNERQGDAEHTALSRRVWDGTPWMVNWYTGGINDGRTRDMIEWCHEQFGEQAWWPSGRPGAWQRGSATINGWEWWGFDTEARMQQFMTAWPIPDDVPIVDHD